MVQFTTISFLALSILTPLINSSPAPAEAVAQAATKTVCTTFPTVITETITRDRTLTRTSTYYVAYPITTWATNTSTSVYLSTRTRDPQTETKTAIVSQCVVGHKEQAQKRWED